MILPIFVVDAFADRPFTGNPAGVCPLAEPISEGVMAKIAMEMNHAETAFFYPEADGYRLRWFTPTVEVDLCGHATLATARVLIERGDLSDGQTARFVTRSGILTARRIGDRIELDFPSEAPTASPLPDDVGLNAVWTGRNRMDLFIQVATAEEVRSYQPDHRRIDALGMRGLLVTAPGDGEHDFVSRCFFPQSGIDEDPVTGSAHCAFAPYWSEHFGKRVMRGYQASRRGGTVEVELTNDRVLLRGSAVITLQGTLSV